MKFLKVFLNSLIGGCIFAILLSLLIFDLNINLTLNFLLLLKLSAYNFLTYGLVVTLFAIISFFVYNFFSAREIKIHFISPNFLILLFSFLFLLFAEIFWANLKYFQYIFPSNIASLLKKQLLIILIMGISGILLYFFYYFYSRKKIFLIIYFILFFTSLPFLFILRNDFPYYISPKEISRFKPLKLTKKVTILCLEGLTFDYLVPYISEGKLPNFSWLMDEGSWGTLKIFTPCEPVVYYNSLLTGKYPSKHFSFSSHIYKLYKIESFFEILPRYIFMRQLEKLNLLRIYPFSPKKRTKGIIEILKENGTPIVNLSWPEEEKQTINIEDTALLSPFFEDIVEDKSLKGILIKKVFLQDVLKEKKALKLKNELNPPFFYLAVDGLKKIKLYFYKCSRPELFGNVPQEEIIKYGKTIEKYYLFYDQLVGKYLSSLRDNELLIVFSPHGIEPLPLWKRFLEWILGFKETSAYYENAPDGVIFFYGTDVIRGENVEEVRLIDIAPTILYYFGFPIGKDMNGVVIRSIFKEEFKSENPIIYISSYDEISIK